jgi:uncharacterized protein YbaR (Trm112 family)
MTEGSEVSTAVSPELLQILVCPIDKAKVELDGDALVCTVCGRRYPIENGIPNMLADED